MANEKTEIEKMLENMEHAFQTLSYHLGNNLPDADEEYMSEVEGDMEQAEKEFGESRKEILRILER